MFIFRKNTLITLLICFSLLPFVSSASKVVDFTDKMTTNYKPCLVKGRKKAVCDARVDKATFWHLRHVDRFTDWERFKKSNKLPANTTRNDLITPHHLYVTNE